LSAPRRGRSQRSREHPRATRVVEPGRQPAPQPPRPSPPQVLPEALPAVTGSRGRRAEDQHAPARSGTMDGVLPCDVPSLVAHVRIDRTELARASPRLCQPARRGARQAHLHEQGCAPRRWLGRGVERTRRASSPRARVEHAWQGRTRFLLLLMLAVDAAPRRSTAGGRRPRPTKLSAGGSAVSITALEAVRARRPMATWFPCSASRAIPWLDPPFGPLQTRSAGPGPARRAALLRPIRGR
jgi:hypothetical protein